MLAASLGAPAQAGPVRDVMIVERAVPHVWIALDGAPDGFLAQAAPGRITVELDGLPAAEARRIVPLNGGPLASVRLEPLAGGARLVIEGNFASAEAELRQGGLWIALDGALSGAGARMTASVRGGERQLPDPFGEGRPDGAPAPREEAVRRDGTGLAPPPGAAGPPDRRDAPSQPAAANGPPAEPGGAAQLRPGEASDPSGGDGVAAGDAMAERSPESAIAADPDAPGPCDATAAAVQASPWDLDALTAHADCLFGLGARDNAAGLYERVLAFNPTHFRAAIGLARIREAQGRGEEAARLYDRAASAAMTDGEALAARAAADRNRAEDEP